MLLVAPWQVAGHVHEGDDRNAEGIAEADEPGRLDRGVDVDRAREHLGLVADDTDDVATEPAEADHDVLGEEGLHLEELAPVEDTGDDLSHVIRLVRQLRHDGLQLDVGSLDVVGGRHERRSLRVR